MCGFKTNLIFDRTNQQTTDKDEINFRTTPNFFWFFLFKIHLLHRIFTKPIKQQFGTSVGDM